MGLTAARLFSIVTDMTTTHTTTTTAAEIVEKDDYGRTVRIIRGTKGSARITRMPKRAIEKGACRAYSVCIDRTHYECDTLTEARILAAGVR